MQSWAEGPILSDLIKYKDKIRKLFYRKTKSEIKDKIEEQKYNFTILFYCTLDGCSSSLYIYI